MRRLLLPSLLVIGPLLYAQAPATPAKPGAAPATQKPAAPTTQKPATPPAPTTQKPPATAPPTTQKPATPPAVRRPATPAGSRAGMAITVTDMRGMTIAGVHVDVAGPTPRMGETDSDGQVNFPGLGAGTYRLRFSGDPVTAFEKEVTVRAGQIADVDVALSAAPPAAEAPLAPAPPPVVAAAPPPPPVGPAGEPQSLSLYDLAERELRSKQPRSEILVACSGNTRSTVVSLITEDQPRRVYEAAEVSYYVLGGQGTVSVGGKDNNVAAGGYVAVPRGVAFSIARRGRGALSLLSVLSGEPCETAK